MKSKGKVVIKIKHKNNEDYIDHEISTKGDDSLCFTGLATSLLAMARENGCDLKEIIKFIKYIWNDDVFNECFEESEEKAKWL